jgi:hypothetical protein
MFTGRADRRITSLARKIAATERPGRGAAPPGDALRNIGVELVS